MNPAFASLIGALFFSAALDDASEPARKPAPPPTRTQAPKPASDKDKAAAAARTPAEKPRVPSISATPAPGDIVGKPAGPKFPEGPAGTMVVPETVYDAGDIDRGTEFKHTFAIRNTGKHPLHIEAKAG